ncbi:MAG: polysaccharide deacetylase family protein [Bacteroidia bacterium]|nr:polysaccharide deacetylase family protein [Bacteroidia bacterium]
MLLVYTTVITNRLNYILKFLLGSLIGCEYKVTTDLTEFSNYSGPRINYSNDNSKNGIWVSASELLFSDEIIKFEPEVAENSWGKIIFPKNENIEIPFDLFAASFYLVSRYEEYLPFDSDVHERFTYKSSVAFKAGILQKPVINIWAKKLSEILKTSYPEIIFRKQNYNFISTIDIDNAFAYKGKGLLRTLGGYVLSLLKGKTAELKQRTRVLNGRIQDPYDSYDFIRELVVTNKINSKVFILSGKYSKFDKNVKLTEKLFSKKIKDLSCFSEIGIHPSYNSNFENTLPQEKRNLEEVIEKKIIISRQHFLMIKFPDTYQKLIENGIKIDYSMGYSDIVGYRAGTCSPFYFFNLKKNEETELLIYPFTWMDRTLRQHLNLLPDVSIELINKNIEEIKELNGTFVSLWHNESLGDSGYWKGWKAVFEKMIIKAKES